MIHTIVSLYLTIQQQVLCSQKSKCNANSLEHDVQHAQVEEMIHLGCNNIPILNRINHASEGGANHKSLKCKILH